MNEFNNPHDKFFKELLSKRANARDFFRYYLPPEIVAELDLRKIELVNDDFIDEALNEHLADLLYRVKLKHGDEAFVFVLFEHKSAPEKFVAFQILRYIVRLWERLEMQGSKNLPPVYPIVIYTGRKRWRSNRDIRSLVSIKNNSPLLKFVPKFEYYLIDLHKLREEDFRTAKFFQKWINQGIKQGEEIGFQLKFQEGKQQGQALMVIKQLEARVGKLSKVTENMINNFSSDKLIELGIASMNFTSKKDLKAWLNQNVKAN